MDLLLRGFVDELVKLGDAEKKRLEELYHDVRREQVSSASKPAVSALRGKGRPVSRDYLASLLIGAASFPALSLLGGKISRTLHNRQIMSALRRAKTPRQSRLLQQELYTGPAFARFKPGLSERARPIMTPGELAADTAKGALAGSVLQMLRDRYSGSAGVS